jgi:hypothetical protein
MSEKDYMKAHADADAAYAQILGVMLGELRRTARPSARFLLQPGGRPSARDLASRVSWSGQAFPP